MLWHLLVISFRYYCLTLLHRTIHLKNSFSDSNVWKKEKKRLSKPHSEIIAVTTLISIFGLFVTVYYLYHKK